MLYLYHFTTGFFFLRSLYTLIFAIGVFASWGEFLSPAFARDNITGTYKGGLDKTLPLCSQQEYQQHLCKKPNPTCSLKYLAVCSTNALSWYTPFQIKLSHFLKGQKISLWYNPENNKNEPASAFVVTLSGFNVDPQKEDFGGGNKPILINNYYYMEGCSAAAPVYDYCMIKTLIAFSQKKKDIVAVGVMHNINLEYPKMIDYLNYYIKKSKDSDEILANLQKWGKEHYPSKEENKNNRNWTITDPVVHIIP